MGLTSALTGTIYRDDGAVATGAVVTFTLCAPRNTHWTSNNRVVLRAPLTATTDGSGNFSQVVARNDQLTPDNTYWKVECAEAALLKHIAANADTLDVIVAQDLDASAQVFSGLDDPDADWVAHGHAQTLTAAEKLQAATNLGLSLSASQLLGQASSGGTGLPVAVTLGTGLAMGGTTLNVTTTSADILPSQTGNSGKYLTTNGTATSWGTVSTGLTVGTTAIASGTTTRVLFDNAGVLGEYPISGTGSVAMTTSPTFTTPALGTPSALVGTNITGTASGLTAGNATLAATVTVANEAADTTCFPLFATAATGSLAALSNAGLTFNSATGLLSATGLAGAFNGTVGATTPATGAFTTITATALTVTSNTPFVGTWDTVPSALPTYANSELLTLGFSPPTTNVYGANVRTADIVVGAGNTGSVLRVMTGQASGSSLTLAAFYKETGLALGGGDRIPAARLDVAGTIIGTSSLTLGVLGLTTGTAVFNTVGHASFTTTLTSATPTANHTATLPAATGTVVLHDATQTLTNKSIVATQLTGTLAAARMANAGVHTGDATGTFPAITLNAAQTGITSVGTLTGGATGAGFTVALSTSTITGNLPDARNTASNSTTTGLTAVTTLGAAAVVTNMPGTTAASSSTTGTLTIGNGTAATNVGIGGGQVRAGTSMTIGDTTLTAPGGNGLQGATYLAVSGDFRFTGGGSRIFSTSDGVIRLSNTAATGFTRLNFGGTTSSFAALQTSGTGITAGLADGTAGGSFTASGTLAVTGATTLSAALITTPQALSGAGAINITTAATDFTSTGASNALTLANGTVGQFKFISHAVKGTLGTGVLTPTTCIGFTTITFNNAGDSVTLRYTSAGWAVHGSFGAVIA